MNEERGACTVSSWRALVSGVCPETVANEVRLHRVHAADQRQILYTILITPSVSLRSQRHGMVCLEKPSYAALRVPRSRR